MSDNHYQYDPAMMFQNWIKNSGNAQAQFVRNFANLMNGRKEFDPLQTLQEITSKAGEAQSVLADMAAAQSRSMVNMLGFGQAVPGFLNWGVYKTSVGSNGRISIPEAERDALGIKEGDLVQVIILPLAKRPKEVKE